jgi:hypothetical protein
MAVKGFFLMLKKKNFQMKNIEVEEGDTLISILLKTLGVDNPSKAAFKLEQMSKAGELDLNLIHKDNADLIYAKQILKLPSKEYINQLTRNHNGKVDNIASLVQSDNSKNLKA